MIFRIKTFPTNTKRTNSIALIYYIYVMKALWIFNVVIPHIPFIKLNFNISECINNPVLSFYINSLKYSLHRVDEEHVLHSVMDCGSTYFKLSNLLNNIGSKYYERIKDNI